MNKIVIVLTINTICFGLINLSEAAQINGGHVNRAHSNEISTSRGIQRNPIIENKIESIESHRSYNGSNNNLSAPSMGAAGNDLNRWTLVNYADQVSVPNTNALPSPRHISNQVFDQAYSKPNIKNASDYLWQWGQFLDHDLDLTDGTEPAESMPIIVPTGDIYFDPQNTGTQIIPFNRSIYNPQSGDSPSNPRQQINQISAWIDASNVYGSSEFRALELRANDGTGRLKTSSGNFLPYNVNQLPNAGGSGSELYLAGDIRANEQIGLTAMHTLFMREHNRLAAVISAQDPSLSGEQVYQQARRIVGGIVQFITYNEFLPLLLGEHALPPYQGYNLQYHAEISNIFSTAAYRFGHSALSPRLLRYEADGSILFSGHLELRDAFFSPELMQETGGFEAILRGLSMQVCQSIDASVIDDIRNFLFGLPGAGGMDLASLNIQRGRDHGLDRFNGVRLAMGLHEMATFEEINPNHQNAASLSSAYQHVDDIDAWVGGLAEQKVPGALVGELFHTILTKQFKLLRDGDRFWYQNDPFLTASEIDLIENSSLAQVIRRNTQIDLEISDTVFIVANLADQDQDGIANIRDNCSVIDNAEQIDSDNDGFGNLCDVDLNNDGMANFLDLKIFAEHYQTDHASSDFNSDGIVNGIDLAIFSQYFLQPIGPSGLHWSGN